MIAALPASLLAAIPLAIAAGVVSFVSPCVLPLLPGYLAFLSGSAGRLPTARGRGRAVVGSLAFILGFAAVFVSFGALFGSLGKELHNHERLLEIIFGGVTVLMGFFFSGLWPNRWLTRERRVHHLPRASLLGAVVLGFTFGLGWSPCVGPTLSAILSLAAAQSDASAIRGSILAFFYCLGLGVPFLIAAIATEWVAGASVWLRRHARVIGLIGGLALVAIGVLEITGAWQSFVTWLQDNLPASTGF